MIEKIAKNLLLGYECEDCKYINRHFDLPDLEVSEYIQANIKNFCTNPEYSSKYPQHCTYTINDTFNFDHKNYIQVPIENNNICKFFYKRD